MTSGIDPRRTTILELTTILWDLGGVVLNFEPGPRLRVLAEDCGLTEDEVFARVWGAGLSNDWDRGIYANDGMYELVKTTIGLKMAYERFLDVMISAFTLNKELLPVIDAVALEIRQAAFTNNPRHLLEAMPVRFPEVAERLDPLIFSCVLGVSKPERSAFEAALRVLDAQPEDVVFIDDSAGNIAAATMLGMTAVRFESVEQVKAELRSLSLLE